MLEFAVNYSPLLSRLVSEGRVRVDRFKCPAWPDLIHEAQRCRPVYVHFPLDVGRGKGMPTNSETNAPADLDEIAHLLEVTGTTYVNTHLYPSAAEYPHIPLNSTAPHHIRQIANAALRDLEPLIKRFGSERVLLENAIGEGDRLVAGIAPEAFERVLSASGCGFLFDLAHARLSAGNLGIDPLEYMRALPLKQVREVHVTGVQRVEGQWVEKMDQVRDANFSTVRWAGRLMDHLPMTPVDWAQLEWMLSQMRAGRMNTPWALAFEYGGVGGFWDILGEESVYLSQLPRMVGLIEAASPA